MDKEEKKEAKVVEVKPTEKEVRKILEEQAQKRGAECTARGRALLKEMDCHFMVVTIREGSQSRCEVIAVPNVRR